MINLLIFITMKSKVFKFVLPAFAFALAIVASFAFTPTHNGEANAPIDAYYIKSGETTCTDANQQVDDCAVGASPTACTVIVGLTPQDAYTQSCQLLTRIP